MENRSSSSTLPANYVTIKDLKERWLKRRQEQEQQQLFQKEQQETGNDNGKNHQPQSESRLPTRSLNADGVNRAEGRSSPGRVRPGRGSGKSGRIGWEYGGGRFDGKQESGRWWSHKEERGNAAVEENRAGIGACSTNQEEALGASSSSSGKGLRDNAVRKSQGRLAMDNVLEATGIVENVAIKKADGENAPSMNGVEEESMSKSNGVAEGKEMKGREGRRKKPGKKTYRGRVFQDKSRPEGNSLHVEKGDSAGPVAVLNGEADELPDQVDGEGALSRKGAGDLSRSKNKSVVVEDGEMMAGDGQAPGVLLKKGKRNKSGRKKKFEVVENGVTAAAAVHGKALLEGAAEKSAPFGKGVKDKSRQKNKNIVKDSQVDAAEASYSKGLRDENEVKSTSMLMQNGLKTAGPGSLVPSEEPAKERTAAKSKKDKRSNWKIKREKDVSVERMVTEAEAGPGGGDVIPVNLSPEIDEQFRNMSTDDNDRREAGPRPAMKDRGRSRKDSGMRFARRRDVSYWMGGEVVWVKKEDTASGGKSLHSSASLELPK